MTVAAAHSCVAISNTPDQLGASFQVVCECGWRTTPMMHVEDAVTLLVLHGIDAALARWTESMEALSGDRVGMDSMDVRRDRRGLFSVNRHRDRAATSGPQAPPRHSHSAIWGNK